MGVCVTKVPEVELRQEVFVEQLPQKQLVTGSCELVYSAQQSMSSHPEMRRGEKKRGAKIEVIEEQIYENVTKKLRSKTPTDYQLILNAFENHFMFAQLENEDKERLIDGMLYCTTKSNEFVFKQGEKASLFFIIERGQCEVIIDNEVKRVLRSREQFGELALMYSAPRSASVRAVSDCGFWVLERSKFRKAVEEIQNQQYESNRAFIEQVKFFDFMTVEQRDNIANVLIALQFKAAEPIVIEGDMANSFYIIRQGSVAVTKAGAFLREMQEGDSFGEQALFGNCVRGATVRAKNDVKVLSLSRDDITSILGDKIQLIIYTNMQKWAFEKHPKLQNLTKMQIEKIVSNFQYKTYPPQSIVYARGQSVDKLIIILDGQLQNKDQFINNGQLFGEQYLSLQHELQNDIVATRATTLTELTFNKFQECIGGQLDIVMKKNQERANSINNNQKLKQSKSDYQGLTLDDFTGLCKLGQGMFGSVYLVSYNNSLFAMKCVSKQSVVQQQTEQYLRNERVVLETICHPMIIQYHRSFKDNFYIYFLTEYIEGTELFEVIREIGLLNSFQTQFYIASLILCLEYLHSRNIIYRDVKPENILVTNEGFIALIDMGTSKILKSKVSKTFTMIGTPHYMAPEIIKGKGYTYSCDLWSLGVCFYEFMCGECPFAEEEEDPYTIQNQILKSELKFPSFLRDHKAIKLMTQLINKTPELRLGASYGALKVNSWFDDFEWDSLENFEIDPPHKPNLSPRIHKEQPFRAMLMADTAKELLVPVIADWDEEY